LLLTNIGVKNFIQNVHCGDANARCRDDAAAAAARRRSRNACDGHAYQNFRKKVTNFYLSNISRFLLQFFQQLSCFSYCKRSTRRHLPANAAFSMTSWLR